MRIPRAREEPSTHHPSATCARHRRFTGLTRRRTHPQPVSHGHFDRLIFFVPKGPLVPCLDEPPGDLLGRTVLGAGARRRNNGFLLCADARQRISTPATTRVECNRQRMALTTATPCISSQVVSSSTAEGPAPRHPSPATAGSVAHRRQSHEIGDNPMRLQRLLQALT